MADREISIPYRGSGAKFARIVTLCLFPFWGVVAPLQLLMSLFQGFFMLLFLILGVGSTIHGPGLASQLAVILPSLVGSIAFSASSVYLGIRSVLVTGDREITLNEQGISFPADFMFSLRFKRQRKWQELSRIMISDSFDTRTGYPQLQLKFSSGQVASINLGLLPSQDQVEQLLLGLQVWSRDEDSQNEIAALLERNGKLCTQIGTPTFTQLWEEQINRRFSSTAFVPLARGTKLQSGRIEIIEPIAFGGLSAVYLAQLRSAETVVLKELVAEGESAGELFNKAHSMFEREARILMKLSDPRIARVLDHFNENGRSYMVLQHVAGPNLANLVRQSELKPEKIVIDWALQLAEILQYIHSQNPPVIHKDVTPDNLVLRSGREVVLIDFGAANEFLGTATGTLVGKQSYIAPEQFKGKAVIQSDIYSFGATLFFLLTGEDPEPLSQSRPASLRAGLSVALDELVADCTSFEWKNRPASAAELFERLSKLSDGSGAIVEVLS
jgi:tRNA A-37 threonylcarbamoyl transferase component Bud32